MNNEYNAILKKLEETHSNTFKDDKGYLESCKANKNLNPKDYKIDSTHKLDEYFNKYGKKLEKGQLLAFKKDELWLMNKNTKYWEINNDSDFIYFALPYTNKKPLWISLAVLLVTCGLVAGSYFLGANMNKSNENNSEEDTPGGGGGEDTPTPPVRSDLKFYFYDGSIGSGYTNFIQATTLDGTGAMDRYNQHAKTIERAYSNITSVGSGKYKVNLAFGAFLPEWNHYDDYIDPITEEDGMGYVKTLKNDLFKNITIKMGYYFYKFKNDCWPLINDIFKSKYTSVSTFNDVNFLNYLPDVEFELSSETLEPQGSDRAFPDTLDDDIFIL